MVDYLCEIINKDKTSTTMQSILIVEDDITFSTMLRTWLGKKGFQAETAGSVTAAKRLLEKTAFDLILSDLRLPDDDGITLLPWKKEQGIDAPLIIMTSYADIQNAVLAMKEGASDYVSKPIKPDLLLQKINDALANGTTADNDVAEKPATDSADDSDPDFLEGESEAARKLYSMVSLVATTQMSVLINGASGTGKEYVAHRIHRQSKRADKPFVAIDCGSIPKELAASEFFGHVKGSFTGADRRREGRFMQADGGTLFLDEIGEMPLPLQAKLLRALQQGEVQRVGSDAPINVDVRVLAATNRDLRREAAEKRFREDLYFRLNVISIEVPSLCRRSEDIPLLAAHFLQRFAERNRKTTKGFAPQALDSMLHYSWPGNVRELENAVERAVILCNGDLITGRELPANVVDASPAETADAVPEGDISLAGLSLDTVERRAIEETLRQTGDNKSEAARRLGITRATLHNKLRKYGLE